MLQINALLFLEVQRLIELNPANKPSLRHFIYTNPHVHASWPNPLELNNEQPNEWGWETDMNLNQCPRWTKLLYTAERSGSSQTEQEL